jgi:hypothetical protein
VFSVEDHNQAAIDTFSPSCLGMLQNHQLMDLGPNIIGATGGSGTRVVARVVRRGGMHIGENLNESDDAVEFGAYSDKWINAFMKYRRSLLPPAVESQMVEELNGLLEKHCAAVGPDARLWGWKEPRSIYLLPFFHRLIPNLKFLHVVRDGRDMAFSSNQNQLRRHGETLLGLMDRFKSQPSRSIALWSRVNLLAADYGETQLNGQYLRLRFEDLCADPVTTINQIFDFFGLAGDVEQIAKLEVSPPQSLGRWQNEPSSSNLHRVGREALKRFGYLQPTGRAATENDRILSGFQF